MMRQTRRTGRWTAPPIATIDGSPFTPGVPLDTFTSRRMTLATAVEESGGMAVRRVVLLK